MSNAPHLLPLKDRYGWTTAALTNINFSLEEEEGKSVSNGNYEGGIVPWNGYIPHPLHYHAAHTAQSVVISADSGSQTWTWWFALHPTLAYEKQSFNDSMRRCVWHVPTGLNGQDLIGLRVLWRCECHWLRLGQTLFFFGNRGRRRRWEVKLPPGSMCSAWGAFWPWINTDACQYSRIACLAFQWLRENENLRLWTAARSYPAACEM